MTTSAKTNGHRCPHSGKATVPKTEIREKLAKMYKTTANVIFIKQRKMNPNIDLQDMTTEGAKILQGLYL
ncbi:hypothetical protein QTO34_008224, partial [Cnephaeus nilssonii]